jgi:hypothetical protein
LADEDETMEADQRTRPSIVGYLVVLLGVAGWAVSCFLPLYRAPGIDDAKTALYRQWARGSIGMKLDGLLLLFGGVMAVGVISILCLRSTRSWLRGALTGAVIVWSLTSTGFLITPVKEIGQFTASGWFLGIGYWCLLASLVCVVVGTAVALVSATNEAAVTRGGGGRVSRDRMR